MQRELLEAVASGDAPRVAALLDAGAAVDARDAHGQTALMRAARDGHEEVVALLLERGAALDVSAKYHLTPLMLAAIGGHTGIVQRLLRAGADPGLRGSGAPGFAGRTAAEIAERAGHAELAALLRGTGGSA